MRIALIISQKNCSREELAERRTQIKKLNELVLAQKEQTAAIKYELELLRCKVASSRELFGDNYSDEPSTGRSEEVIVHHHRTNTPRRKMVRTVSELTPEIHVELCESEASDENDTSQDADSQKE